MLLQPLCEFEECTEQGSAIVLHQIDQPGLLHQAAEFDELTGTCAPVLNPLAGIVPAACEGEAVVPHGQTMKLGVL